MPRWIIVLGEFRTQIRHGLDGSCHRIGRFGTIFCVSVVIRSEGVNIVGVVGKTVVVAKRNGDCCDYFSVWIAGVKGQGVTAAHF